MKTKQKFLSIFIVMLICIGMIPTAAMADTTIDAIDISVTGFGAGNKIGGLNVVMNAPADGLSDIHYSVEYSNPGGGWTECTDEDEFDLRKLYAIKMFVYPKPGYTTAGLIQDNVKVNGEVSTYFDNPFGGEVPPGYPEGNTLRLFHYFHRDLSRNQIGWTFDLVGGAAPDTAPDAFDPYHTMYRYKQGDTVEVEEFFRLVGKEPVKPGFVFKGWKCTLLDGNDLSVVLKELDGYYDFGGGVGIPLDVPSPSDKYALRFIADLEPKGTQTIKSIDINILNFNEGNTLADIKIQHLSDPKLSAYFKNFYLCHYTPSGSKERDEYVGYVIDGTYNYWFELFFVPEDGFHSNDLSIDDINVNIDGFLPEFKDLMNPAPDYLLPDGMPDNAFAVMIKPFSSMLDNEKWCVVWEFNLDGGKEPVPNIFDTHQSTYLYKHGDTVVPEEFEYFKGVKPEKEGYSFKGWIYKLCECSFTPIELGIPAPLGKYIHDSVVFDADAGVPLDEKLTDLPGSDLPYLYYIEFKAVWEKNDTPDTSDDTPDTPESTPDTPESTPDTPESTPDTPTNKTDAPKTGDDYDILSIAIFMLLMILGLILLRFKIKRGTRH